MKLYDVPRNTKIRLLEDSHAPVGCEPIETGTELMFDHIDGMYSFCMDEEGRIVHVAAFTEVEIID